MVTGTVRASADPDRVGKEGPRNMPRIDAFRKIMQQSGASDLHLGDGYSPFLRMHGVLESTQHRVFTPEEVKILFFEMLTDAQIRELEDAGEIDIMYELRDVARFRINIYKKHVGLAGAFRIIPTKIPTLDGLGSPKP